jgi:hypothetical protein
MQAALVEDELISGVSTAASIPQPPIETTLQGSASMTDPGVEAAPPPRARRWIVGAYAGVGLLALAGIVMTAIALSRRDPGAAVATTKLEVPSATASVAPPIIAVATPPTASDVPTVGTPSSNVKPKPTAAAPPKHTTTVVAAPPKGSASAKRPRESIF